MLERREVLKKVGAGVSALPLAAVLADPELAKAAAHGLQTVTTTTAGGKEVSAAVAMPATLPAPAVILIHEWWGLNDHIKAVAADFAAQGYIALAIDLMDGQVATTPDAARAQIQEVGKDPKTATDTCVAWAEWLRAHKDFSGKLGTCGYCFGGAWSLNASIATPVDATVVYYGRVDRDVADLQSLQGPVLGHFATLDKFINKPMVDGFVANMSEAGKDLTAHWYEADHAFANPTGSRYDEPDAALAWERTKAFLAENLGV